VEGGIPRGIELFLTEHAAVFPDLSGRLADVVSEWDLRLTRLRPRHGNLLRTRPGARSSFRIAQVVSIG
jgi:hypothetical protein